MSQSNPDEYSTTTTFEKLRTFLVRCEAFGTDKRLRAVFVDERLISWKNDLPEADSVSGRVRLVIEFLYDKYNAQKENALVLLLLVLKSIIDPEYGNHQHLESLATVLKNEIAEKGKLPEFFAGSVPPPPNSLIEILDFVGREKELADCAKTLKAFGSVGITGIAGIGKTTLANILAQKTVDQDRVFWFEFLENNSEIDFIAKLAGFLFSHGQKTIWQKMRAFSEKVFPSHEELFNDLIRDIQNKGYLLLCENYHYVTEDSSIDRFIRQLQIKARKGEVSLVITSRAPLPFLKTYEIEGLRKNDFRLLLTNYNTSLSRKLVDEFHMQTEGNPIFFNLVINDSKFQKDPEQFMETIVVGTNVKSYLSKLEGVLNTEENIAMTALSVMLGQPASQSAIEAVAVAKDLGRSLKNLTHRGLLTVTFKDEYRQHSLIQEFFYRQLGPEFRHSMHERAAEFFKQQAPLVSAQHYELIGQHLRAGDQYSRGYDYENAQEKYREAAKLALDRGDIEEHLVAKQKLGEICFRLSKYQQAIETYQDVLKMMSSNLIERGYTYYWIGNSYFALGQHQEALKYIDLGLQRLVENGLQDIETKTIQIISWPTKDQNNPNQRLSIVKAYLLSVRCAVLTELGQFDKAAKSGQEGLARVQELGPEKLLEAMILNSLGINAGYRAQSEQGNSEKTHQYLQQALSYHQASLRLREERGSTYDIPQSLENIATAYDLLGQHVEAISYYLRALKIHEQTHNLYGQASTTGNLGLSYINQGSLQKAEEFFYKALDTWQKISPDHRRLSLVHHDLGDLYFQMNQFENAEKHLLLAIDMYKKHQIMLFLCDTYLSLSKTYKATNQIDRARSCAQLAIETALNDASRRAAEDILSQL